MKKQKIKAKRDHCSDCRNARARNEAMAALNHLEKLNDPEEAHIRADQAICKLLGELGYIDVVVAFDRIKKWYS